MNLYQVFTDEINAFFVRLKQQNLFYKRIISGQIEVDEFASFLRNVSFLTSYTPVHLILAERVATQKGHTQLAAYFKHKRGEEVDHHRWGDDDIAALKKRFKVSDDKIGVIEEMQHFIAGNEQIIREDPFAYFIYILFSEYFTVIAGPECMAAVEKHAKIPQSMMSVIGKHVELDKDHVHHWADESTEVGLKPEDAKRYMAHLQRIMDRYSIFVEGISKVYVRKGSAA